MKLTTRWTPSIRAIRSLLAVSLVVGGFAACSEATAPTPKIVGSFVLVPNMRPEDVTPDGTTVLFTDLNSASADFYLYNVAANSNTLGGSPGDALFDFANGISSNLEVSAIHGKPEQAGVWSQASGWTDLGNIYPVGCEFDDVTHQQDQSGAFDISADGAVVVGLVKDVCKAVAFLHNGGGFVSLDVLGTDSRASAVSDDGLVAGGWASKSVVIGADTLSIDRWPAVWHANGSGFLLPAGVGGAFPTVDSPGEVLSVSADGSMVAGIWALNGFYWTQASGVIDLGRPAGAGPAEPVFPNAIAADNKLIFGTVGDPFGFDPMMGFVWTEAAGIRSIQEVLTANNVVIPTDFTITNINAASADGTVVAGLGYDANFTQQAFILKVPVSVYGL